MKFKLNMVADRISMVTFSTIMVMGLVKIDLYLLEQIISSILESSHPEDKSI